MSHSPLQTRKKTTRRERTHLLTFSFFLSEKCGEEKPNQTFCLSSEVFFCAVVVEEGKWKVKRSTHTVIRTSSRFRAAEQALLNLNFLSARTTPKVQIHTNFPAVAFSPAKHKNIYFGELCVCGIFLPFSHFLSRWHNTHIYMVHSYCWTHFYFSFSSETTHCLGDDTHDGTIKHAS